MTHPLIDEAMKKAAVAWVAVGDEPPRALWCMAADGALWVVTGPGEQSAPGLAEATTARVTLRGDHGGRIVTWPAAVTAVAPDDDRWEQVVPQLAAKRLNASGEPEALLARWAAECTITALTPAGDPLEAGPTLPDGSLAQSRRDASTRRCTRPAFPPHRPPPR